MIIFSIKYDLLYLIVKIYITGNKHLQTISELQTIHSWSVEYIHVTCTIQRVQHCGLLVVNQ